MAVAATVGVFLMPWLLASSAAWLLNRFMQRPWLKAFGGNADGAVVLGLQLATVRGGIRKKIMLAWCRRLVNGK